MATWIGLEPTTSSVTGWHSNQLNYQAVLELMYIINDVTKLCCLFHSCLLIFGENKTHHLKYKWWELQGSNL